MQVHHQTATNRFIIETEAGESQLCYRLDGKRVDFYHTFVQPANRGSKVGILLVQAGLNWAQQQQLDIAASCWYVDKYIAKHGLAK